MNKLSPCKPACTTLIIAVSNCQSRWSPAPRHHITGTACSFNGGGHRLMLLLLYSTLLILPVLYCCWKCSWPWESGIGLILQSLCDCVMTNALRRFPALWVRLDLDIYQHTPTKTLGKASYSGTTAFSGLLPGSGWKVEHQAPVGTH